MPRGRKRKEAVAKQEKKSPLVNYAVEVCRGPGDTSIHYVKAQKFGVDHSGFLYFQNECDSNVGCFKDWNSVTIVPDEIPYCSPSLNVYSAPGVLNG